MRFAEEHHADLSGLLSKATLMDVTPAAQWFLRDDERTDYAWKNYDCLIPVYDNLWVEFAVPRLLRVGSKIINTVPKIDYCGHYLSSTRLPPDVAAEMEYKHHYCLRMALETFYPPLKYAESLVKEGEEIPSGIPGWMVLGLTNLGNDSRMETVNLWGMTLDLTGKLIAFTSVPMPFHTIALIQSTSRENARKFYQSLSAEMQASLMDATRYENEQALMFCLQLMHCRNVQVVDAPETPAPIRKQRAKRGVPDFRYKLLDVQPLKTVPKAAHRGSGENETSPKAMHFVRGHFKRFDGKGLFGKYIGTYWWGSQVRGDHEAGIIDKDYRVRKD